MNLRQQDQESLYEAYEKFKLLKTKCNQESLRKEGEVLGDEFATKVC